jgi:hypothetical protein
MPWPLYLWGKSPWYLMDRRLVGLQSQSRCSGEKRNPCQESNPGHPAHSLVTIMSYSISIFVEAFINFF